MSFLQAVVSLAVCEWHPLLFRLSVLLSASCRYVPHPTADRTLHLTLIRACGLLMCSGGCLFAQLRQLAEQLLGFRLQRINLLLRHCVDAGSRLLHPRDSLLQRFQLRVSEITNRPSDSLTRRLGRSPRSRRIAVLG